MWICFEKVGWSIASVLDTHKRLSSSPPEVLISCPDSLPVEVDMPGCWQSFTFTACLLFLQGIVGDSRGAAAFSQECEEASHSSDGLNINH